MHMMTLLALLSFSRREVRRGVRIWHLRLRQRRLPAGALKKEKPQLPGWGFQLRGRTHSTQPRCHPDFKTPSGIKRPSSVQH